MAFNGTLAAPPGAPGEGAPVDQLLEFIYTLAHRVGQLVVGAVQAVLPDTPLPPALADPIGLLVVLTAFVALAEVARKVVWAVIVLGWLLIAVRLVLVITGVSP